MTEMLQTQQAASRSSGHNREMQEDDGPQCCRIMAMENKAWDVLSCGHRHVAETIAEKVGSFFRMDLKGVQITTRMVN
jgi:hypothetical protein